MFKDLGAMAGLLRQLPKIREEMEQFQQRLGQLTAEGSAGGGLVTARVNGKMELLACTLSDDALKMNDREMLEDMIRAAVNQAFERVRQQIQEESAKMATGFGLPPGLGLPGLSGS
jgi:nucleoid-associated protein EbfC